MKKTNTSTFAIKNASICIFNLLNTSTINIIKASLSCWDSFIMSAILNQKRGRALILDFALSENESCALSANQNAGSQCKITSANQGVVQYRIYVLTIY